MCPTYWDRERAIKMRPLTSRSLKMRRGGEQTIKYGTCHDRQGHGVHQMGKWRTYKKVCLEARRQGRRWLWKGQLSLRKMQIVSSTRECIRYAIQERSQELNLKELHDDFLWCPGGALKGFSRGVTGDRMQRCIGEIRWGQRKVVGKHIR